MSGDESFRTVFTTMQMINMVYNRVKDGEIISSETMVYATKPHAVTGQKTNIDSL